MGAEDENAQLMKIEDLIEKIKERKIKWRGHASKRIMERNIDRADVIVAFSSGKIIEEYQDDFPFPSFYESYQTIVCFY